jgi:hypothetical protein
MENIPLLTGGGYSVRIGEVSASAQALSVSPLCLIAEIGTQKLLFEEKPMPLPYLGQCFLEPTLEGAFAIDENGNETELICLGEAYESAAEDNSFDRELVAACAIEAAFVLALSGLCHTGLTLSSAYINSSQAIKSARFGRLCMITGLAGAERPLESLALLLEGIFHTKAPELKSAGAGNALNAIRQTASELSVSCDKIKPYIASPSHQRLHTVNAIDERKGRLFFSAYDEGGRKRFIKEGSVPDAFVGISSPYLVEIQGKALIYSAFSDKTIEAFSSPFYDLDLNKAFAKRKLSSSDKAGIFLCVLLAIRELACMGKVHRDIKPSNILCYENSNGSLQSLVSDYDTVAAMGEYSTSGGYTPGYSHPSIEEGSAQVSVLFDIYSAGALLYLLYSGKHLFSTNTGYESKHFMPAGKAKLKDAALQRMVEKSICPLGSQKRDGWGYGLVESKQSPLLPIDAFINEYLSYISVQQPDDKPHLLVPQELAFYASRYPGTIQAIYELSQKTARPPPAKR